MRNRLPGCLHHPAMSNDLGVLTRLPDGRGRPASNSASAMTGTRTRLGTNQATPQQTSEATAASQNTSWNAAKAGSCWPATVTVTRRGAQR